MTSMHDLLRQMHEKLAGEMLAKLDSGEVTAAELNVIRQFLKDNEITQLPVQGTKVFQLAKGLPFDEPVAQGE